MKKYWKELRAVVIAGIGAFILATILPPRVTITSRELIFYVGLSLFKNWVVTVTAIAISILLFFLLGRFRKPHRKKRARSIWTKIAATSVLTLTVTFFFSLYNDLIRPSKERPMIGFGGCYTLGSDGVLVEDSDAEYIGESLFLAGQKVASTHSSFSLGLFDLRKIQIPGFLPPLLGRKNLDLLMQKRAGLFQYVSLIYCYHKPNNRELEFRTVFFSEAFKINNLPYADRLEDDLSSISDDPAFGRDFILNFASEYYVAVMGQCAVDYLVSEKKYRQAHIALDDSETVFRRTFGDLLRMGSPSTIIRIRRLENYWYADLARLRAELLIDQGDYPAAARHSLLALDYDEYFPCRNYEDFSLTWMQVYASELKDILNGTNNTDSITNLSSDDTLEINAEWAYEPAEELIKNLAVDHGDNPEVCAVVENGFKKLLERRKDDPLIWLCWGDIVKFLPKGSKRDQKIYIERIPESREAYETARKLDPNFPLIPIKLSALKLIGTTDRDTNAFLLTQRKEALELISQGSDIYRRYLKMGENKGVELQTTNSTKNK